MAVIRELEPSEARELADAVQLGVADMKTRVREVYG